MNKRSRTGLLPLLIVLCNLAVSGETVPDRLIDLTHSFDADTVYWPTEEPFRLEKEHEGITEKGYYYAANRFHAAEHGGTHIDAPIHFAQGHQTLEQVHLDRLVGPAILVDVTAACAKNRDYRIAGDDFTDWEHQHGRIPRDSIVLLRTGYAKFWPDLKRYLGTDEHGKQAVAKLHFPGLHPEAAHWLASERHIKAIGIDTASIDYGQSTHYESHRALSMQDIPIFENLADLGLLPHSGFEIVALPMKIKGGSGGPLRIIARIEARP